MNIKKIIAIVLIVVVAAAAVTFVPKLVHTCDDCEGFFIGWGYEPNIISDIFSEDEQIICKDCAEEQHAIEIALGKDVKEFQKDPF